MDTPDIRSSSPTLVIEVTAMRKTIVKRNANAALVNLGEYGYWVIVKAHGRRVRLFAGDTLEHGNRVYNWYRR